MVGGSSVTALSPLAHSARLAHSLNAVAAVDIAAGEYIGCMPLLSKRISTDSATTALEMAAPTAVEGGNHGLLKTC